MTISSWQLSASCSNPPGNDWKQPTPTGEWLLIRRGGSTQGLRVQHRVDHRRGQDTFQDLLPPLTELPSTIKEILVVNAVGIDRVDGGRQVLHTQQQRPLLNNGHERIRLVDRVGTVLVTFDLPNRCDTLPAAPKVVVGGGTAAAAFGEVF